MQLSSPFYFSLSWIEKQNSCPVTLSQRPYFCVTKNDHTLLIFKICTFCAVKKIHSKVCNKASFIFKGEKNLLQPQTRNTSGMWSSYRHELTAHIFYLSLELHQNISYNYSISKSSFGVSHLVERPWQCEKPVKSCKSMSWLFWFCLRSQKKSLIIVKNETFDIQVISRMASIFLNNEPHWILTSQQMLII